MQINRHNYEEFFLLYVDNELSAEQRAAVEAFISENSDLAGELEMLQQSVFLPEESVVFDHKNLLMQAEGSNSFIDAFNCEELFIQYADDELNNEEKAAVEQFVYRNPQFQASFEIFQQTKLTADTSIVFPDKESLYKHEEERRVVPFRWWRIAAAAVILLVGGLVWINSGEEVRVGPGTIAGVEGTSKKTIKPEIATENSGGQENTKQDDVISATTAETRTSVALENNSGNEKKFQGSVTKTNVAPYNNQQSVPQTLEDPIVEPTATVLKGRPVSGVVIDDKTNPDVATNNKINASEKNIIDKPETIESSTTTDTYISYASNNDDVLISNVAVDKRNSLRGIFRKAGRFIEKTTTVKPGGKGIQIGAFTIAGN